MLQYIDVNKIEPHPDNPRKDLGDLSELAESIRVNGILQNLTVVPWFSEITRAPADDGKMDGEYRVVIGHRRLAAAKMAGFSEVPCVVADMSPREQVATMLLENIQRSDLTIYEQAQGFQMMLNFGDTVNDIAERTGFSQTTVRRRVKLLELDQKKFKESVERGATLMDYAELEKVKNPELRNSVLEHIGTNNFNWHLGDAIEQEAMPDRRKKLFEFLEGWAQRIEKEPKNPYNYTKCFYRYKMDDFKKPKDADKGGYTFFDTGTDIRLYKKEDKSEKPQVSAAEKAFKECEVKIKGLTKQAFELRREFVLNFSGGKTKAKEVMDFTMIRLIRYGGENPDELLKLLDIDVPDGEEKSYMEMVNLKRDLIIQKYLKQPERTMLAVAWATTDNEEKYYEAQSWNKAIKHRPNDTLDAIYGGLIALGYEMSDEERRLQDGSHELFQNEA